jgi:hypothetical protein
MYYSLSALWLRKSLLLKNLRTFNYMRVKER